MKRPALLVIGLLLLAFISIYFIVPQYIVIRAKEAADVTDVNVARFLVDQRQWHKWWPGTTVNDSTFKYKDITVRLTKTAAAYAEADVQAQDHQLKSRIDYIAIDEGSTAVTWEAKMQSSLDPFARIVEYIQLKSKDEQLQDILLAFKKFVQKDVNVYGLSVRIGKVTDGLVLATNSITATYPTADLVNTMVARLHEQVKAAGLTQTNQPMLNINLGDDGQYHTMAAIPVNKRVATPANFVINKLVVGGNLLQVDVKGGRGTIDNAFAQLKRYQKDHRLTSPAMPYERMITDRAIERDTSKWVTQVCWPIL